MPSPLAHAAAGYLVYRLYKQKLPASRTRLFNLPLQLVCIAGLALLPDLDVVPGLLFGDLGRFHNNLTHSLVVGVFVALLVWAVVFWQSRTGAGAWFAAALLSYELHVIMDCFAGERGVMLLWPFTSARFSAPVRLFVGVQWGDGLVSVWHLYTILTESLLILGGVLAGRAWRRLRRAKSAAAKAKRARAEARGPD